MNEFDYEEHGDDEAVDEELPPSELELSLRARFMRRYGRDRTAHIIASAILRHLDEFPNGLASRDVIDAFAWFYRCVYGHNRIDYATYHLDDTRAFYVSLQRIGRRARRAVIACLGDLRWSFVEKRATRKLPKRRDETEMERKMRRCNRFLRRTEKLYPELTKEPNA